MNLLNIYGDDCSYTNISESTIYQCGKFELGNNVANYCGKCGGYIDVEGKCQRCGWSAIQKHTNSVSPKSKAATIGVCVLLLFVAIGGFLVVSYGHSADIAWRVHSTHITEEVDIIVYINGKQVASYEDVQPGWYYYNTFYYKHRFSLLDDSVLIKIEAVSTGGGLGMQFDSEHIIVHSGGRYSVDLYV